MTEHLTALFNGLRPLWEMSVTAAWVTEVVLLLRLFLKNRAPRRFVCLLWLVVFARLLVPAPPESPVSLVPPTLSDVTGGATGNPVGPDGLASGSVGDGRSPQGTIALIGPSSTPAGRSDALTGPPNVPTGTFDASNGPDEGIGPYTPSTSPARSDAPSRFPWQALLAGVWLAGVLAMSGFGLISYVRLRRRVRFAVRVTGQIWEDENVASPFILGLARPKIYLPSNLEGRARRFILCHEFAHLRRLDHIVKPVCWFALAVHWFNPAAWAAFLLLSRDMEGACDEAVLRSLGEDIILITYKTL